MTDLGKESHISGLNARELSCTTCGRTYIFRECEQAMFIQRGWTMPTRCPACRKAKRDQRRVEREQRENRAWLQKKAVEKEIFDTRLMGWNVVSKDDIHPESDQILYVIGNGFDLMHGVRSSYYAFRDSLGKENPLRYALETYLMTEDIWADFENALAHFNLQAMCSGLMVGDCLDLFDACDANASDSAFFLATEVAANPILTVANDLPRRFRMWVETLSIGAKDRPLQSMFRNGKVLCFNYTEFVETLYGVSQDNVCYIHGCRRKEKGRPKEDLILGHAPGASEDAYDFEDDSYIGTKDSYKLHMMEVAQEQAFRLVAESDEILTKNCGDIITAHETFFSSLEQIKEVIFIGHSYASVDWDYFFEVASRLPDIKDIRWYFGCYNMHDLGNLEKLLLKLNIQRSTVSVFRTDDIAVVPLKDGLISTSTGSQMVEKTRDISPDSRWTVKTMGCTLLIVDQKSHDTDYEAMFSSCISDAFFVPADNCLFVVIGGVDPGVFLFRMSNDHWKLVNELKSIPNQSVINRRLCHVFLTEREITFVYNSRVRSYSLADGILVTNRTLRNAKSCFYEGDEISRLFLKAK